MPYSRGDIVLVLFPDSNLSTAKRRPALVGGKGGGRSDMATGGGNEPEKLEAALEASYETVERMLERT